MRSKLVSRTDVLATDNKYFDKQIYLILCVYILHSIWNN